MNPLLESFICTSCALLYLMFRLDVAFQRIERLERRLEEKK